MMVLVVLVFWACTFYQNAVYGLLFSRLARYRIPQAMAEGTAYSPGGISVIVCVRNEEDNIRRHLHDFLDQQYSGPFEVIVVDDASADGSRAYLRELEQRYSHLRVVEVPFKKYPGKKAALALGISLASFETILLSDADCRPASRDWIAFMAGAMRQEKEMVLGFSPYLRTGGILNTFIRFEGIYTAMQYFSFALAGMPYMGVGRNLMYRRVLFHRAGGFEAHLHKASGDDDLLVNVVAEKENTAIQLHPGATVWSRPQTTVKGYIQQKARHFSTGLDYRWQHRVLLGSIALAHSFHYAAGMYLVLIPGYWEVVAGGYLLRMAVVQSVYFPILKKLSAADLWKWIPLLDMLLPLFYLFFSLNIFSGKSSRWKA